MRVRVSTHPSDGLPVHVCIVDNHDVVKEVLWQRPMSFAPLSHAYWPAPKPVPKTWRWPDEDELFTGANETKPRPEASTPLTPSPREYAARLRSDLAARSGEYTASSCESLITAAQLLEAVHG